MLISQTSKTFSFKGISIILLMSIIIVSTGYSQAEFDLRNSDSKHEISIGVADLFFNQPDYYPYYGYMDAMYYPYSYPYYNEEMPKVTLKYKYSLGKIALRAGFDFAFKSETNQNDQNDFENETSRLFTLSKIGFEWQYDLKKVQLFTGIDFYSQYKSYKYSYDTYYYDYDENGNYIEFDIESKTEETKSEYGISPFIGIKLFINENFSISTETNYLIGHYNTEYTYSYIEETSNTNEGTYVRFGQIGIISFNVHF